MNQPHPQNKPAHAEKSSHPASEKKELSPAEQKIAEDKADAEALQAAVDALKGDSTDTLIQKKHKLQKEIQPLVDMKNQLRVINAAISQRMRPNLPLTGGAAG